MQITGSLQISLTHFPLKVTILLNCQHAGTNYLFYNTNIAFIDAYRKLNLDIMCIS